MDYFNYYNTYGTDLKNFERNNEYITLITNMMGEMFEVKGMSHDYSTFMIRQILHYGSCLVKKINNGKFIIAGGHYKGMPKPDEIYPSEYFAHRYDFTFDGIPNAEKGETIVYLVPQLQPCEQIYRFASQFAEIDTSLVNNIQFARIAPIAVVSNDRVRELYEKALGKMLAGELVNSILSALNAVSDKPQSLTTLDISDGKYSEKIQYLSMYHEQMISRLCKLYGISYTYISKQANITNDELHNSDDFCAIYPLMFKKFLNLCLNKIGLTADFSKPWEWINHLEDMHDISDNNIDNGNEGDNNDVGEENTQND